MNGLCRVPDNQGLASPLQTRFSRSECRTVCLSSRCRAIHFGATLVKTAINIDKNCRKLFPSFGLFRRFIFEA